MKHTDVLLGIQQPPDYDSDGQKHRKQRLDYLQAKLAMVQSLAQHEGWKLFQHDVQAEEMRILSLLETADNPTTIAKLNGSLLTAKSFGDWCTWVAREVEAMAKEAGNS